MTDSPKIRHLRPLPGGAAPASTEQRLEQLEQTMLRTLSSFEARLEQALTAARSTEQAPKQNERELRAALSGLESRIRSELAQLRQGYRGDLAQDINELLSALQHQMSGDRTLARLRALRLRLGANVDPYGYDAQLAARLEPIFDFFFHRYFRTTVDGIHHLPQQRALVVGNHSGALPWDGLMLAHAVKARHPQQRQLRVLAEDSIFHFPYLGVLLNRLGQVRACPENAERLLAEERLVAVFPEGVKGLGKLYRERYQLQRFGRGGFVKLALRTGAPIVPTAIIGAEETHPMLARVTWLVRDSGVPYVPLSPAGLWPLPAKWRIIFGPPIDLRRYGPDDAEDCLLVGRLTEQVRSVIQQMVGDALAARRSVWFG